VNDKSKPLNWFTGSYSGGNGDCVEIAFDEDTVLVRHSKNPDAGTLAFTRSEWTAFSAGMADGEFRQPTA
jgi:hypothetical protein